MARARSLVEVFNRGTPETQTWQKSAADSAMRILQELAASEEVELAMFNNEARELNDYRIERFELGRYFDVFLSSCYLGLPKPGPKFFELALDVLQREKWPLSTTDKGTAMRRKDWEFMQFTTRMRNNARRRWSTWALMPA